MRGVHLSHVARGGVGYVGKCRKAKGHKDFHVGCEATYPTRDVGQSPILDPESRKALGRNDLATLRGLFGSADAVSPCAPTTYETCAPHSHPVS